MDAIYVRFWARKIELRRRPRAQVGSAPVDIGMGARGRTRTRTRVSPTTQTTRSRRPSRAGDAAGFARACVGSRRTNGLARLQWRRRRRRLRSNAARVVRRVAMWARAPCTREFAPAHHRPPSTPRRRSNAATVARRVAVTSGGSCTKGSARAGS